MIKIWIRKSYLLYKKLTYLYPILFVVLFIMMMLCSIHFLGKIRIDEKQELKIVSSDIYMPLNGISNPLNSDQCYDDNE